MAWPGLGQMYSQGEFGGNLGQPREGSRKGGTHRFHHLLWVSLQSENRLLLSEKDEIGAPFKPLE